MVWIDKPHDCDERICFPNNDCHGKMKKTIFHLSQQWLLRRKMFNQKHGSHGTYNINFIERITIIVK